MFLITKFMFKMGLSCLEDFSPQNNTRKGIQIDMQIDSLEHLIPEFQLIEQYLHDTRNMSKHQ